MTTWKYMISPGLVRLVLSIVLFSGVSSATTLFIPSNGSTVYFQESPDPGLKSFGQTFVPGPLDNTLTDFSFFFSAGTASDFEYAAYVFEWGGTMATGPALFFSGPLVAGSNAPAFTGLSVPLDPAKTYIALLTVQGIADGTDFDGALLQHNSANVYPGGQAYILISPQTGASWTTTAWTPLNGNTDLRFEANLITSMPEPASIAMALTGLAWIAARVHSRRQGSL